LPSGPLPQPGAPPGTQLPSEPALGGGLLPPVNGLIPPAGGVAPGLDDSIDTLTPLAPDEEPSAPPPEKRSRQRPGASDAPAAQKVPRQSTLSLSALVTAGAESRTNVAFEPDGEGDVAGVVTPEIQLRYRSRRLLWKTAYRRTAEAYLRDSALNTLNRRQGAETVLQARLTARLGTTATAAWRDTRDPVSEILAGTPTPSRSRAEYREWTVSNGWTRRITSRVDGDLAYQYLNVQFPTERLSSRQEHQAAVGSRIRATKQDSWLAQYDLHHFLFETGTEYRVHGLTGGYEHRIVRVMLLRLQAGLAWLDGPGDSVLGYLAAADTEWRREVTAVRVRYEREFAALSGVDSVLSTHVVSASTSRRFSRATDVGASSVYRWQRDLVAGPVRTVYQTWTSQLVVSQKASDRLAWSASGAMVWQSARAGTQTTVVRDYRLMVSATFTTTTTFW
jgi:hypothetical protein